ncbi:CheR family methyltransferase [Roseinatronobacter monicus]|uniref:histidine kinase n=1 Tax=Roseinatronobacter monicus TaxID=393481 RepID=A0A543K478_9RHOB|nr:CheR family methyltransferase [Roseinatronobacter monicus]TQM89879.1 signal transduction histidine kinase [Roseinatronobacter monicus]
MTQHSTLVVGLGASAGGIHALKAFFSQIQDKPDMAFVVVTHLSPDRESLLHEVLSNFTTLRVEVIKDGDPVQAGVVHVMPANVSLSIKDGCLRFLEVAPAQRERKPIDVFFSALGTDQEERAVGIVLSGGDGDGTLGVQAIKEHGGVTFAQVTNGSGLDHPEMPKSAIASGWVDFALPAKEMPGKLLELQHAASMLGAGIRRGELDIPEAAERRLQGEISKLLREHSGRDFAGYKKRTFFRRVARRMQVTLIPNIEAYLERLREDPAEVLALFKDLMISVTDFFRDKSAFDALSKNVMPLLLAKLNADDSVRVWVPGCATGQEAYSLAILIREHMQGMTSYPKVLVFATDIDEPALTVARSARYPDTMLKTVSKERKARFFRKDGSSHVLVPEIRDMCIFSAHSLTTDPPFSQMDLVSCRNLLIYLGSELQKRVIPTFHYALKPGGFLFLGSSESLSQHENLFTAIDKKNRIYQSLDLGNRRPRIPIPLEELCKTQLRFEQHTLPQRMTNYRVQQRAERQIIDRHSPAHVVVRSGGDIVFFSARTRGYFDTPRGAPSRQLFDIVRRELRQDLRLAFREAQETGKRATRQTVLSDEDTAVNVAMTVEPLNNGEGEKAMFLIVFRPLAEMQSQKDTASQTNDVQADADASESALRELHERLHATIEEYETALEELNASSEELASVCEEAQSSNEELQASKEEMQSLNEELSTVNAELNDKVDELSRANTDLRNLYDATGICSVFLDGDMMIRNFTPAAATFFKLRQSDIGRPLTELASTIKYPVLQQDVHQVFNSGDAIEHRLPPNGYPGHHLVRSVPYFDQGVITGVVVTFIDITSIVEGEDERAVLVVEAAKNETRLAEVSAADARKARLMAALAHDLRIPLIAILGTLDLFREDTGQETRGIMLHRLKGEGHGMLTLIDDVLEVARLGAGEVRLRPELFAPIQLLTQVADLVRVSADRRGTRVEVQSDPMPMLLADVTSLRRILLNFATNAVKATRNGCVQLSGAVSAANPTGVTVILSVSDNGCGIAPEDIPLLFRDFGMLDRQETIADGSTGLGLAICRRLATAMGGEVGVESTPGKGSRFWLNVTLPEADTKETISDHERDDPAAALSGLKVLVAEDHETIRQLTCANLARFGMLCIEAADGEAAVALAESKEFDMILMDLQMPKSDGAAAAARIRRSGGPSARAWIFGLTAHQPPEIAVMLSDLSLNACLSKPLDVQQLAALTQSDALPGPASRLSENFSRNSLAQLHALDGGELLSRALKNLSVEIEATRTELAVLISKGDAVAAGRLVHKLVGFSDMLGAVVLSAGLRKFEDIIQAGDLDAMKEGLKPLDDAMSAYSGVMRPAIPI